MPFCQSCGAPVSGAFCTICGTRAKTGDAPPPAAPNAAPAVARRTSPIVWILVAVLGLFLIAVVGGGILLVHKAKQAGFDAELMRDNPGLATAKLLVATNPDLEIVSSDDGRSLITIRQKSTGKTMTVTFDDMKRGNFTFRADDGAASESLTLGAGGGTTQAKLPPWVPAYPNSKPVGVFSLNATASASGSFKFQTRDAAADVVAFYERELKQAGFHITANITGAMGTSSGGLISGDDAASNRTVVVAVGSGNDGTTVSVTYSQK